jgi:hypothetical protein
MADTDTKIAELIEQLKAAAERARQIQSRDNNMLVAQCAGARADAFQEAIEMARRLTNPPTLQPSNPLTPCALTNSTT